MKLSTILKIRRFVLKIRISRSSCGAGNSGGTKALALRQRLSGEAGELRFPARSRSLTSAFRPPDTEAECPCVVFIFRTEGNCFSGPSSEANKGKWLADGEGLLPFAQAPPHSPTLLGQPCDAHVCGPWASAFTVPACRLCEVQRLALQKVLEKLAEAHPRSGTLQPGASIFSSCINESSFAQKKAFAERSEMALCFQNGAPSPGRQLHLPGRCRDSVSRERGHSGQFLLRSWLPGNTEPNGDVSFPLLEAVLL